MNHHLITGILQNSMMFSTVVADAAAALRIAMVLSSSHPPPVRSTAPPSFFQFPVLRSIRPLRITAPCTLFQPPVFRSVPRREVKAEAKKTGQVWLVSSAGTGYFYTQRRSSKKLKEKLELRKYDPRVKRHVVFSSAQIKSSASKKTRQRTKRKSRSARH